MRRSRKSYAWLIPVRATYAVVPMSTRQTRRHFEAGGLRRRAEPGRRPIPRDGARRDALLPQPRCVAMATVCPSPWLASWHPSARCVSSKVSAIDQTLRHLVGCSRSCLQPYLQHSLGEALSRGVCRYLSMPPPEICHGKPYDQKSDVWCAHSSHRRPAVAQNGACQCCMPRTSAQRRGAAYCTSPRRRRERTTLAARRPSCFLALFPPPRALGCVLYELLALRRPFEAASLPALILSISK